MEIERTYKPPSAAVCKLISETLPKIHESEKLESQELSKKLISLYSVKDHIINSITLSGSFSWLYHLGILDFEEKFANKGGMRLYLYRVASGDKIVKYMNERPYCICRSPEGDVRIISDVGGGEVVKSSKDHDAGEPKNKNKKAYKYCCKNQIPARSKKTGKIVCRSCRKTLSDIVEKPESKKGATCCKEPRLARSKKTGKVICRNCKTLIIPGSKKK